MLYLGLGSNLGEKAQNLCCALEALSHVFGPHVACSQFYATEPVGFRSENTFLNAAVAFNTRRDPFDILHATQEIERKLGRTGKSHDGHYADRIIDIDLLIYDNVRLATPELTLPHPALTRRRFALEPLAEIAPDLDVDGRTVTEWLEALQS